MSRELALNSAFSGLVSVVIGVVITYGFWLATSQPWGIRSVMLAVGVSSFFSGFSGWFFAVRQNDE